MNNLDPKEVWADAYDKLRSLDSSHRLRKDFLYNPPEPNADAKSKFDNEKFINFGSNNYLGLDRHPETRRRAIQAVEDFGSGSMASRLVGGTLPIHHELEKSIAAFKGTESALVFSSGYLASQGIIQALSRRADDSLVPILFDRLSHASLIDGAKQERRNWRTFPHNNTQSLELLLLELPTSGWPSAIVVTEGVFSMDGTMAPLKEMSELCARYNAILVVDDAHATGTIGTKGEGSVAAHNLNSLPHVVQVGTLSKALGAQGGYVAGPKVLHDLLVNTCRSFIFDTALAPASCGAALGALSILQSEPERVHKLHENINLLRAILNRKESGLQANSPIIPVIIGDEDRATKAADLLREQGYFVPAVRPPTVPPGTSRLRITLSSEHNTDDVHALGRAIGQLKLA